MLKLLTLSVISASLALAINLDSKDKTVLEYETKRFTSLAKKNRFDLKNVEIIKTQPISKEWKSYLFKIQFERGNGLETFSEVILSNGEFIAPDLINAKSGRAVGKNISVDLDESYYNDANLLYGSKDSKHKLVIFSDPVCPFCMSFVPKLIDDLKNQNDIALYFYHFPLTQIHPSAPAIIKASLALEHIDKKYAKEIYQAKLNPKERDEQKVIDEINKKLGTKLTLKDINTKEIKERLARDMEKSSDALINSTPSIFFDGKKDATRVKYKDYLK